MSKLVLNGGISTWWISADFVRRELAKMVGDIEVHISSFGGDFYEGMEIFNLLREYSKTKGKVTTINISKAMSAGSHIFLAGDVRKAYSNSTIMCHCAWLFSMGDTHGLARDAKILDGIDGIQASLYKRYQDKSIEDIKADMRDEMWYIGSEQLLASGFVDEIIEVEEMPSSIGDAKSKYNTSVVEYKTEYMKHEEKHNLDDVEASISACKGDCKVATMPIHSEKIANSTKGKTVKKTNEELQTLLDTANATIEANKSEVDGIEVAHTEELAKVKADEAKRIQDVSAIIPTAHKENKTVLAKLYDVDTSVNDMKAFIFDLDAEIAAKAKEVDDAAAASVSTDILDIDNASEVDDEEDAPSAEQKGVDGYFGGNK